MLLGPWQFTSEQLAEDVGLRFCYLSLGIQAEWLQRLLCLELWGYNSGSELQVFRRQDTNFSTGRSDTGVGEQDRSRVMRPDGPGAPRVAFCAVTAERRAAAVWWLGQAAAPPFLLVKRKPHAHLYTASTYTADFFVRPKRQPVMQHLKEMKNT